MHALDTSKIVIQIDCYDVDEVFVQETLLSDHETTECQSSKPQLGKLPIELLNNGF